MSCRKVETKRYIYDQNISFLYLTTLLRIALLEHGAENRQRKQGEFGALIPSEGRKGGGVERNKRGRRNAKIPRR
jgi:hypothetical protein